MWSFFLCSISVSVPSVMRGIAHRVSPNSSQYSLFHPIPSHHPSLYHSITLHNAPSSPIYLYLPLRILLLLPPLYSPSSSIKQDLKLPRYA